MQTASKLPFGVVDVASIGAQANDPRSVPGVIYVGAAGGDCLGWSGAGLGDVTRDSLDDVALGAPGADPGGNADAGNVYLVEGWVPPSLYLGVIDLAQGFPGTQWRGGQAGENAGAAVCGVGDADGDADGDWIVGAPGHDGVTMGTDAGIAYLVLECGTSDVDADGVLDCQDNCPMVANAGQQDTDGDGIGDWMSGHWRLIHPSNGPNGFVFMCRTTSIPGTQRWAWI